VIHLALLTALYVAGNGKIVTREPILHSSDETVLKQGPECRLNPFEISQKIVNVTLI